MKIKGKHEFKCGDREQVWDKLVDIECLRSVIPGLKGLKQTGNNTYKGKLPLKMPAIKGKLATTIKLEDLEKPKHFRLYVWGKNSAIKVSSKGKFKLSNEPGAIVKYEGNLNLSLSLAAGLKAGLPHHVNKQAKQSLEKGLASLFRKIDRQCCKENGDAH